MGGSWGYFCRFFARPPIAKLSHQGHAAQNEKGSGVISVPGAGAEIFSFPNPRPCAKDHLPESQSGAGKCVEHRAHAHESRPAASNATMLLRARRKLKKSAYRITVKPA